MAKFKTSIQLGIQTHDVESDDLEEYMEIVGYLNVLAQTTEGRNAVLYAETRGGFNYKGWLDVDTGHKLDFGESMNPAEKSRRFFAYSPHSDNYKGYVDGQGRPAKQTQQSRPAKQEHTSQAQQEPQAQTMQQKLENLRTHLANAHEAGTLPNAVKQAEAKVAQYTGNWKRQAIGILEQYQAKLYVPAQQSADDDLPF